MNNWIKKGGSRQPRKVEMSRKQEEQKDDRQSRKIEIRSEQIVITNDRQPRKVEIKDEEVLIEKDHQPRKVKVNRLPELFETEFSAYPLSMPRKVLGRICFFSEMAFAKSETMLSENETIFTEGKTRSLFSEQNIYGANIMEKVAACHDQQKKKIEITMKKITTEQVQTISAEGTWIHDDLSDYPGQCKHS